MQQSRIQQLEQSTERLAERQRRLDDERALLAADPEDRAMLELDEQLAASELDLEALAAVAEALNERPSSCAMSCSRRLAQQQAQGELQRLNGRIASLKPCSRRRWSRARGRRVVARRGLEQRPRLADGLRVEPGWELAVETVLGADLQAVLLDDFAEVELAGFQQGALNLVSAPRGGDRRPGSLLERVESALDLSPWLGHVRPVESLEHALAERPSLAEGESLVSRDGYWVGRHFLRVRRASEAESGVLARGQELQRLLAERDEREASLAAMEDRVTALSGEQSRLEGERELQRRQQQEEARKHSDLKARLSAGHARLEQLALRRRRLDEELAEQQEQREIETEQLGEARLQLQEALEAMAQDTEQRETLLASRDGIRERLDRIRRGAAA